MASLKKYIRMQTDKIIKMNKKKQRKLKFENLIVSVSKLKLKFNCSLKV